MYKALYRKYRPKVFSDVIGQNHITSTLKHELVTDRLSHAYLFIGSRGTGKTTCAKILAKAINCPNSKGGDPCGECEICRGIDDGSVTDVVEIDAASNNGVDNIRDLRDEVNYTPVKAKYRVYIIDEVHMLSPSAFNALLKTLEEPPEHVKFILATTEANKLPATILSRCQRFDFKHISPEDMVPRLEYTAMSEGASLSEEAALLIGRLADGAMRDAMSILDQCVSTTDSIDADVVRTVGGVCDKTYLYKTAEAVLNRDSETVIKIINKLYADSVNMESFLTECLNYFRNMMIVSSVKDASSLVNCSAEEFKGLKELSSNFALPTVLYIIDELQQALSKLKLGADRKLTCEMVFIKLSHPLMDNSQDNLLRRVAELEVAVKNGVVPVKEPVPTAEKAADTDVKAEKETSNFEADEIPLPTESDMPVESGFEKEVKTYSAQAVPEHHSQQTVSEQPVQQMSQSVAEELETKPVSTQEQSVAEETLFEWTEIVQRLKVKNFILGQSAQGTQANKSGLRIIITKYSEIFKSMVEGNPANSDTVKSVAKEVTGIDFKSVSFSSDKPKDRKDPLDHLKSIAELNGVQINIK